MGLPTNIILSNLCVIYLTQPTYSTILPCHVTMARDKCCGLLWCRESRCFHLLWCGEQVPSFVTARGTYVVNCYGVKNRHYNLFRSGGWKLETNLLICKDVKDKCCHSFERVGYFDFDVVYWECCHLLNSTEPVLHSLVYRC